MSCSPSSASRKTVIASPSMVLTSAEEVSAHPIAILSYLPSRVAQFPSHVELEWVPILCPPELTSSRRQPLDLPEPKLPGIIESTPKPPHPSEVAAKSPQRPVTPPQAPRLSSDATPKQARGFRKASMDYPEDPWNTPDVHKNHNHPPAPPRPNGGDAPITSIAPIGPANVNGNGIHATSPPAAMPGRTTSTFTTSTIVSATESVRQAPGPAGDSTGTWAYFPGSPSSATGFGGPANQPIDNAFGSPGGAGQPPSGPPPIPTPSRTIGSGRPGTTVTENILVTLMPEKEGLFLFQHHNYEVTSSRRVSKVVRRYSDFVWLLDCLHKRYPFRVLPLLPPKRVAGLCSVPLPQDSY